MDRGAWWATVHGVAKDSDATEQLNNNNGLSVKGMREHAQSRPLTPHNVKTCFKLKKSKKQVCPKHSAKITL